MVEAQTTHSKKLLTGKKLTYLSTVKYISYETQIKKCLLKHAIYYNTDIFNEGTQTTKIHAR